MTGIQKPILDALEQVHEVVLTDLELTIRNSCKQQKGEIDPIVEQAIQDKLRAYRTALSSYITILRVPVPPAVVEATPPTAPEIEEPEENTEPCEYCNGQGSTGFQLGFTTDDDHAIPCISCDGSGKVFRGNAGI